MSEDRLWKVTLEQRQINVVGRKNHGKTGLIEALVVEMSARGLVVGTVKHSPHMHMIDTPGKDSNRHRAAGARPAAVATAGVTAVFLPPATDWEETLDRLVPLYSPCDVILVEGRASMPHHTKVEVWRSEKGTATLASEYSDIAAIISDDEPETSVPVWPRADVPAIVDRLLARLGRDGG